MRTRVWLTAGLPVVAVVVAVTVAACGSSGPATTGLGATSADWDAHHGAEYSSVVTDSAGRVEAYMLAVDGSPLSQAEALVLRDLPADATASAPRTGHGVEGTVCEIVEFTSPTLGGLLGGAHGDRVMAAFSAANATVMDPAHVARVAVDSGDLGLPIEC